MKGEKRNRAPERRGRCDSAPPFKLRAFLERRGTKESTAALRRQRVQTTVFALLCVKSVVCTFWSVLFLCLRCECVSRGGSKG